MLTEAKRQNRPLRSQFVWIDANGDGVVDDNELDVFSSEQANGLEFKGYWRTAYDSNLTQYLGTIGRKGKKRFLTVRKWPVHKWNSVGAPVYKTGEAKIIAEREITKSWSPVPWANSEGKSIFNVTPLLCFDKTGKELWSYPNQWSGVHGSHDAPKDENGLLVGTLKVIGSAKIDNGIGEVVAFNGNMGKAFFMTLDGLYIGSIFKDCRSAPDSLPDKPQRGVSIINTTAGSEWFGGEFFQNKIDGKYYIGSSARNCQMLSQVTGFDTIRRIPHQKLTLTKAMHKLAQQELSKRKEEITEPKRLDVTILEKDRTTMPSLHGFKWWGYDAAMWKYDDTRNAQAAMVVDTKNLYIAFKDVHDATPMSNNGKELTRLFKTGDAALLELRPTADNLRGEILPGDLRIIFSVFNGKPVAILYRYKALPGENKQPEDFTSPVMTVTVEVVKVLENAEIKINRKKNSYTLIAKIPLKELAWKPIKGKSYRADFGIVYSDKKGVINEQRMNWSNRKTGLVADLPGETLIDPKQWGTLVIK